MRLIDADKLMSDIEHYHLSDGKFQHWVEIQPTIEPEPHWIPCSERYPEQDERVIVTIGDYDYFVWDCMSNRGDDYFWEDEQGFYHNKYEVIAWMPMPELYGGEQE
jgi:hypothetical protein